MDWYLVSVLVFILFLAVIIYRDRKKFTRESILLLRKTKRGRGLLIKIGTRFPRGWKLVGYVSVATGFVVSVLGVKMLIDNAMAAFAAKVSTPSLALLVPTFTSEPVFGYGFLGVPFWYWIICIGLLVLVHEGFHGIFAAREGVRIKSLGFGILAILPLAFVEPDEKQLEKKGLWPMLRVFSAGSFANFLLAGLSLAVIIFMVTSIFTATGVAFGVSSNLPYPATRINLSSIQKIGDVSVEGMEDIKDALATFGENDTLEIKTANNTFLLKKILFVRQLNVSRETLVAFEDYPAARAGLEGTIIRIDGDEIKDPLDMTLALEKAGPGKTITIVTRKNGEEKMFSLTTVTRPPQTAYKPDASIRSLAAMEQIVPGSIEFFYSAGESWDGLMGQRTGITWSYVQQKIGLWEWVSENYPLLKERAEGQINYWKGHLESHPEPGFMGITGVIADFELKEDLEGFKGPIDFIQGLLFFMLMINLGVGIVNLLPLKPLDGGRMWDVVLKKYLPGEYAKKVMRVVSILTLLLIIVNFIPFGLLL